MLPVRFIIQIHRPSYQRPVATTSDRDINQNLPLRVALQNKCWIDVARHTSITQTLSETKSFLFKTNTKQPSRNPREHPSWPLLQPPVRSAPCSLPYERVWASKVLSFSLEFDWPGPCFGSRHELSDLTSFFSAASVPQSKQCLLGCTSSLPRNTGVLWEVCQGGGCWPCCWPDFIYGSCSPPFLHYLLLLLVFVVLLSRSLARAFHGSGSRVFHEDKEELHCVLGVSPCSLFIFARDKRIVLCYLLGFLETTASHSIQSYLPSLVFGRTASSPLRFPTHLTTRQLPTTYT